MMTQSLGAAIVVERHAIEFSGSRQAMDCVAFVERRAWRLSPARFWKRRSGEVTFAAAGKPASPVPCGDESVSFPGPLRGRRAPCWFCADPLYGANACDRGWGWFPFAAARRFRRNCGARIPLSRIAKVSDGATAVAAATKPLDLDRMRIN
jgi:hypothetical protein